MKIETLKTLFPDFDVSTLPPIPDGWIDDSWINDACPCFHVGKPELSVFVDYEKLEDRQSGSETRFSVHNNTTGWTFDSDDWDEILKKVEELKKEG